MLTRILLLVILVLLVSRAFGRLIRGLSQGMNPAAGRRRAPDAGVRMVRDPVCGTFVVPSHALQLSTGASSEYFCSEKCRAEYQATRRERARTAR